MPLGGDWRRAFEDRGAFRGAESGTGAAHSSLFIAGLTCAHNCAIPARMVPDEGSKGNAVRAVSCNAAGASATVSGEPRTDEPLEPIRSGKAVRGDDPRAKRPAVIRGHARKHRASGGGAHLGGRFPSLGAMCANDGLRPFAVTAGVCCESKTHASFSHSARLPRDFRARPIADIRPFTTSSNMPWNYSRKDLFSEIRRITMCRIFVEHARSMGETESCR